MAAALAVAIVLFETPAAFAQDAPDTVVETTVIVDDKVVVQTNGPATTSGLVVDPVVEGEAERIRRDAVENRQVGRMPNIQPVVQPKITVVSVDSVTVDRPNTPDSDACVTIGKVGTRRGCRPPR